MADVRSLNPDEQVVLLRILLAQLGHPSADINEHLARMVGDDTVTADLVFHQRERDAMKAGRTLPPAELVAHYAGPLHNGPLGAPMADNPGTPAPTAIRGPDEGQAASPVQLRHVVAGVLFAAAAGLVAWGVTRESNQEAVRG